MNETDTVSIATRFRGPPTSGNGGYVCGLLGLRLPGPATVRLMSPPPLETALQFTREADALRLLHAGQAIAQGRAGELAFEAPPAPTLAQAEAASQHYAGFHAHPFPGCFVCGPERAEGDGLRIFPAAVPGTSLVAAPWTPSANLASDDGKVHAEFVWSALDCTGFFAFGPLPDGSPALLGELTARIEGEVIAGEPHIAAGWLVGEEGRKRFAGSALYGADGTLLAVARATWIVIASPPASPL